MSVMSWAYVAFDLGRWWYSNIDIDEDELGWVVQVGRGNDNRKHMFSSARVSR